MRKLIVVLSFFILNFLWVCNADAPHQLSLQEAILLAVRKNPNVQVAQLDSVLKKYNLEVQEWDFHPHYALTALHTTTKTYSVAKNGQVTSNVSGISPAVSLLTQIGTTMTLSAANNLSNNYNPGVTFNVVQPLLKGFGRAIVESQLYDALDSEKISRLNVEGELRNTVTEVINAYLDFISAKNTLEIDQQALEREENSLLQTQQFIKAGHKAGMELVTVKAGIANIRTRLESDKNNVEQAYYALLTCIGIDPDSHISFSSIDINKLIKKYHIPALNTAKDMTLNNDIQYQIAEIMLEGSAKRAILIAKDNTRWQLDLDLNASTGNGSGGGPNAGINSLVNGINRTNSATLNLTVPIDDVSAKNALASQKIALQQSRIALQQQKWVIQKNAINSWRNITSTERVLRYADDAEILQKQTYHLSAQKYSFGLIDSLELQTAQIALISAQKDLVDNRINYLKALVIFDNLTGKTLSTWNVLVNYS